MKKTDVIDLILYPYRGAKTTVSVGEEEIKEYVRSFGFLEDSLHFSRTSFVLVEFEKLSYLYVSSNIQEVLGWPQKLFQEGGPVFGLSCLHQDDMRVNEIIHATIVDFFGRLPDDERARHKFAFTSRVFRMNGEQMMMMQNNFFLKWDQTGKPLMKLFTITDITPYKTNKDIVLFVTRLGDDGTSEVVLQKTFQESNDTFLTRREIEIINKIALGHSAKEIAGMFSISEHTVKTHKKNIMNKLGCTNAAQMTSLASLYGLLTSLKLPTDVKSEIAD